MVRGKKLTWSTVLDQVPALLAVGAGICLLAMITVLMVGVIMRYVVGNPLLGVNELVQFLAVTLAMLALPYCTRTKGHVRVDLFDNMLGRLGRRLSSILFRGLAIATLFFLCRRAWAKAAEAIEFGDVSNMLLIPIWPFYGAVFAGMALCALIYIFELVGLITGRGNIDD